MRRPRSQPPAPAACARAGSPEADIARVRESRSAPRGIRCPPSPLARSSSTLLSDLLRLDLGNGCRPGSPGTSRSGAEPRDRRECAKAARGHAGRRGTGDLSKEFATSYPREGCLSPSRSCAGVDKAICRPGHHVALPRTPGWGGDAAKWPSPPGAFLCPQTPVPTGPRR